MASFFISALFLFLHLRVSRAVCAGLTTISTSNKCRLLLAAGIFHERRVRRVNYAAL
jgi:hypothetical protein